MRSKIHPRPCPDWPSLFWVRAADSCMGNDLACRRCGGRGLAFAVTDDLLALPVEDAVCRFCRGSGLLVPRQHVPNGIAELLGVAEDGLAWVCVSSRELSWPLRIAWTIDRRRFPIKYNVYVADEDVIAFMQDGSVIAGLFREAADSRQHLEAVFRMACGDRINTPDFVVPWLDR
jgi:hypothetical protein